jgi:FtsP/CotA-like multicopper oxidase with cupredoxin domain
MLALALAAPPWPSEAAPPTKKAQQDQQKVNLKEKRARQAERRKQRITLKQRQEAGARALQEGAVNPLMVVAPLAVPAGQAPHYFSHPNYANSPLPTPTTVPGAQTTVGNVLSERAYATDNATTVFVVLQSPLPDGFIQSFEVLNQASAGGSVAPSAGFSFHAYVLRPTGTANQYTVVFDSGLLTVPALTTSGTSQVASFGVANLAVQNGDRLAFYGQGVPLDTGAGTDVVAYPVTDPPAQGSQITVGSASFPLYPQARTYSFAARVIGADVVTMAGGLKKFVDGLPGLGSGAANNLGQYIPVAVPDTATYAGSDYYVIELGQYTEKMHSDLKPTTLRGYRQANMGGTPYHYLGPAIVATKNRPVRILFRNLLPTGAGGNLFIPVDTTVMGSGMTPTGHEAMMADPAMNDPLNPMCSQPGKADMVASGHCYAENRATLHLHGGVTPWISDGTPHQWITPAGENTPYPKGVSVVDVPDMATPGPGEMTFFYTNQQSARLMFYHDHAWGITRLNVYAGEAAPYIITDDTEKALVAGGAIPGATDTIPLVIQDKTFVPSAAQLAWQDETWDVARWGGEGNLWLPHVYVPAQNPGDSSGVNQFGRWAYGPWFHPPTLAIDHGPIANAYYDATCNPDETWCEPPLMPGTPFLSMGMEAFHDTPVVNGTAYPTVTVEPKSYRLRILNAANDRFFNLSLYRAVDADGVLCDATNPSPAPEATGVACTEVKLNAAEVAAALEDPAGVFPTPVAGTEGPAWIQFGTEGGFLPAPVVIPAQTITWVTDPTVFNAGNVDKHSLLLGPAERADVVVDFSQYAGQTLILYNDAPAAFPARDPRYDYYTGNPDLRESGGAPSTLPGWGPNTRTVMQIKVAGTPGPAFNLAKLQTAFRSTALGGGGVFEQGQHPIIVGQGAYNSAYGTAFQSTGPNAGLVNIFDTSFSFKTLAGGAGGPSLTMPLQPKMIQDEMGEAFEKEYGRMSGNLGVEAPNAQAGLQNMILYAYPHPPTEVIQGLVLPPGAAVTPIARADDGTQIWKVTHNGVDTHPIHFHLYDVQLVNRVGWDGIIRKPDANELGWKDTVRISPLEDTIVALRPIVPHVPFDLPNSVRLLDPSMPEGVYLVNTTLAEQTGRPLMAFDPNGEPIDIVNHYVNFGWEYVWHCHILSHEEMDMMRSQVVGVAPRAPTGLAVGLSATTVTLSWTDNSLNETGFRIQRATDAAFTTGVTNVTVGGNVTTYTDSTIAGNQTYYYRVSAINVVGDTWDYSNPALNEGAGFPTMSMESAFSNTVTVMVAQVPPAAPSNLVATVQASLTTGPRIRLTFFDNARDETGFVIERSVNGGAFAVLTTLPARANTGSVTYTDGNAVLAATTYSYRVFAVNGATPSDASAPATVTVPPAPLAPANFRATTRVTRTTARVDLTWVDSSNNESRFVIQRATDAAFTTGVVTVNRAANSTTLAQTGLPRGATYYYRIVAQNGYGQSVWVTATPFPITTP